MIPFIYCYTILFDADLCAIVEMAKEESNAAIDKRDDFVKEVEKRMGNDMEKIYNRSRGL